MLENKEGLYVILHTLSGASAAAFTTFFLYPIENLKTRLQDLYHS